MADSNRKRHRSELQGRLEALMLLRVIFVSLLLGISIVIQINKTQTYFGHIQTSHYVLISFIYFLTFIYIVLLKKFKNLVWISYFQLLVDTLLATTIIYTTGGIESIFIFLYILTIINASIILYRRGGMVIATSSSILYGSLVVLQSEDLIFPLGSRGYYGETFTGFNVYFLILVNITAFYLVAFLSSYLSEQAKKSRVALKAKQIDIYKLEILNESIIKSINSGLIALDGMNRVVLSNPAAEEIFGFKAPEISGREAEDVLPFLKQAFPGGPPTPPKPSDKSPAFVDFPYLRPDGENIHLRLSVSPLHLPRGGQEGSILIFQDMTAIKQIEEQMKRVEDLALTGELAAGIAHEIRNPMAAISGSIQMLKSRLGEKDVNTQLMNIISREISRLNHLVNDFLTFARPKKPNLKKIDLNRLILDSLELFKNSSHWSKDAKIQKDFSSPADIVSDAEQIRQVLWNLFLNASEAMPREGVLHIKTEWINSKSSREDAARMKIIVRDTGKGFSKEDLSKLFVPFYTTKAGGTGLGLATVKRIVEGLQGEVSGRNHPDGGAQIEIILPASPSEDLSSHLNESPQSARPLSPVSGIM